METSDSTSTAETGPKRGSETMTEPGAVRGKIVLTTGRDDPVATA